jgi:hypothetical protein
MCLGLASCTGASGAHACGDVDLDAVGSLDWMHWTSAGPAETKAAAARLISCVCAGEGCPCATAKPATAYGKNPTTFSWAHGSRRKAGRSSRGRICH